MKFAPDGTYLGAYPFGWDTTPGIRVHDGTYSIVTKENHYNLGSYCFDERFCPNDRTAASPGSPEAYFITQLDRDLNVEWRWQNTNPLSCTRDADGQVSCVSDHPARLRVLRQRAGDRPPGERLQQQRGRQPLRRAAGRHAARAPLPRPRPRRRLHAGVDRRRRPDLHAERRPPVRGRPLAPHPFRPRSPSPPRSRAAGRRLVPSAGPRSTGRFGRSVDRRARSTGRFAGPVVFPHNAGFSI